MFKLITFVTILSIPCITSYHWVDGPVEKKSEKDWHCPGLYCGRSELNETHWSECGKCDRGWRVSNNTHSICKECSARPTIYDGLFLIFHVVLVLVLHWMAIDLTAKRQKLTQAVLTLHVCATGEVALAACVTLLLSEPVGTFYLHACRIKRLSDWYTYFHNPSPNYQRTLNCTQEAVYPFYTMIFIFYGFCGVMMLVLRPLLASKLLPRRGRSSIFAALYFLPVLALIHAVGGGLVYASFPYIVLIVSLVSSAFHFAFKLNQKAKALFIGCVKDSRSAVILIGHWLLHAFGILAITEIREPELHLPFLALIPVPALFYIATARFSNPENFISDSNRDGTTICHWCVKLMINKAKKKKGESMHTCPCVCVKSPGGLLFSTF